MLFSKEIKQIKWYIYNIQSKIKMLCKKFLNTAKIGLIWFVKLILFLPIVLIIFPCYWIFPKYMEFIDYLNNKENSLRK